MNCILSRAISYHYQCRCLPIKEETLLCSTCLELFLGFPGRFWFSQLCPACFDLLQLIPGCSICYKRQFTKCFELLIYKKLTLCQILLQSQVSVITKWEAFCFTKLGKCYYKIRLGIPEWHNFYYKIREGSIPKWGNHSKE